MGMCSIPEKAAEKAENLKRSFQQTHGPRKRDTSEKKEREREKKQTKKPLDLWIGMLT